MHESQMRPGPGRGGAPPENSFATDREQTNMRPMSRAPSPMIATGAPGSAAGWRVLAVAALLILAALGAYWNSFNVPFLLDDSFSISDNSSIRHLGRIGAEPEDVRS